MTSLLPPPLRFSITPLLLVLIHLSFCPVQAVIMVDMQMDGNVPLAADGNQLLSADSPYSLASPFLDATSFTSNGATAPQNASIYGGIVRNGTGDAVVSLIHDNADNSAVTHDVFRLAYGSQTDYDAALVWQKPDFLNGGASATVSIDSSSTLTLLAEDNAGPSTNTRPDLRWLIVKDGTTYASTVDPGPIGNNYVSLSSGDLTALDWFQVDFATNFRDPGTPVNESAIGLFDDIDGVGVYFSSANDGIDTSAMGVAVSSFTADLAIVPEPSTALLTLGAAASMLLLSGRRGRRAS